MLWILVISISINTFITFIRCKMTSTIKHVKEFAFDPFNQFIKQESASSIIMLFAMVSAMALANSAYSGWYFDLWHTKVGFTFGDFSLYKSLHHWINDGLMALFFLMVGLEIKREIIIGELSSIDKALLPIIAAIGGAVVPAVIYAVTNMNSGHISGWGVPMATDIAFAVGVLALLGNRVPFQLKVFITSLAVVDDMIAVLVIAFFYTEQIITTYLIYSGVTILVLVLMNFVKVKSIMAYLIVGAFLWFFFLKSGIHATLAGVLLALFIPSQPKITLPVFKRSMLKFVHQFENCPDNPESDIPTKCQKKSLNKILHTAVSGYNPMSRLEYNLHGLTAFLIMPLFAFANTGISISVTDIGNVANPLGLGIIMGLFIGKPIGILSSVFIAVKLKIVAIPAQIKKVHLAGASMLSGIGLTMSIFISSMAFTPEILPQAKMAILIASVISGISGYMLLKFKG